MQGALGNCTWLEFTSLSLGTRENSSQRLFNLHFELAPFNRKLFGIIRRSDMVYFVTLHPNPLIVMLSMALLAGRKRVVAGIHTMQQVKPYQAVVLRLLTRTGVLHGLHVVFEEEKIRLERLLGLKFIWIPNGVDCEKFKPDARSKGSFNILFVGAMSPGRGADILPDICRNLEQKGIRDFKMTICTIGGPLTEEIRTWATTNQHVTFNGFTDEDDLSKLYRESTVVIMPSRTEAPLLVALEAQASGTPVLISATLGLRQAVVDGKTGVVITSCDAEQFANQLMMLHRLWRSDQERYRTLCRNAQKHVEKNYCWNLLLGRLFSMFQ